VLSIDGGGVRGIVPLTVLSALAKHMDDAHAASTKPSDCFDLIVGTSTGGILAVLLGALLLTVPECIKIYKELSARIFRSSKFLVKGYNFWSKGAKYDEEQFEEILKDEIKKILEVKPELLGGRQIDFDKIMLSDLGPVTAESQQHQRPRVAVIGRRGNANCAFCFSNFKCAAGRQYKQDELLWKVLRATSAAPFFFPPIKIGQFHMYH
jgi:patatin-like phospholipase/acyl hydrolase